MLSYDLAAVDLTNSNLWDVEQFTIKTAQPGPYPNSYVPIPEFEVPIFQGTRVMMATCYNPKALDRWWRGCYLKQVVGALAGAGTGMYSEVQTFVIPVSTPNVTRQKVFFPSPAPITWKMICAVPSWHEQIELRVYRFTGILTPPLATYLGILNNKLEQALSQA